MGKNAADILFSTVRRDVLAAMLLHPQKSWYLSELGRHIGAAPSHLHRELAALTEAGILTRRVEGRQTYFEADPGCPFLPELTKLLTKLVGIPSVVAKAIRPLRSKIRSAFIYGSVAQGKEVSGSDIDLLVVGDITTADLIKSLKQVEKILGRPVNPTIYPANELVAKRKAGHHFISTVLKDPAKQFVVGTLNDLEAIIGGQSNQAAPNKQSGAGRATRSRRGKT